MRTRGTSRHFCRIALLSEGGVGLLEVVVAMGLILLVLVGVTKLMDMTSKSDRRAQQRSELNSIRNFIREELDCELTFAGASINPAAPGASCPSTTTNQQPPYLVLRRATASGANLPLGSVLAGNEMKIGDWTVRASCSSSEQTLVIRVAKPKTGGGFEKDPVTQVDLGWSLPSGLVASSSLPLCFSAASKQGYLGRQDVFKGETASAVTASIPAGAHKAQVRGSLVYATNWPDWQFYSSEENGGFDLFVDLENSNFRGRAWINLGSSVDGLYSGTDANGNYFWNSVAFGTAAYPLIGDGVVQWGCGPGGAMVSLALKPVLSRAGNVLTISGLPTTYPGCSWSGVPYEVYPRMSVSFDWFG